MTSLGRLQALLENQPGKPPIDKWNPPLSGDIDIVIQTDGQWLHEGGVITRQELVKLFASILRREDDGHYYLVTPVEKWRIRVEDLPLQAVEMETEGAGSKAQIALRLNTDEWVAVNAEHPLDVATHPESQEPSPALGLNHGLAARVSRSVFYQLVELAEQGGNELFVYSGGERYSLGKI